MHRRRIPQPADNSVTSVAHAVQLFRRACFEAIGGTYLPLPYGGPVTYAEVTARMKGWRVASFPDLEVLHHRVTGSAGGLLRGCFRQGRMDHSLGTLPLFEILKVLRRLNINPYLIGSAARLAGFMYSYYRSDKRPVSDEFVGYFRQEGFEAPESVAKQVKAAHSPASYLTCAHRRSRV
jgi:hypothetical protein